MKILIIILSIVAIIILGLIGLFKSLKPLGKHINKETSSSYFYTKDNEGVLYCQNGNWFSLGEGTMEADKDTFVVLSEYYAKDKDHAYYRSQKILAPIDIATFSVKDDHIPIDKNHVYTIIPYDENLNKNHNILGVIPEADPDTYTFLDYNWNTDKNHVFLLDAIVKNLEVNSFKLVSNHFCSDKNGVYYYNTETLVTKTTINLKELEVLADDYICDAKAVYHYNSNADTEADRLQVIPYQNKEYVVLYNPYYLRIDTRIFCNMVPMKEVDINSFKTIDFFYAKDKNNVFYDGEIIAEADVNTFKLAENGYDYTDKNNTYKFGEVAMDME